MAELKVIVLGGSGYLGQRTIEALKRATGVQISVAGRRAPLVVDLADPRTYSRLNGADIVIDLASSPENMPDALGHYCIKQGITFVETSADRAVMEALPRHLEGAAGPGQVILGAGIFPGLSNLVARAAAGTPGESTGLKLGISSSVFSGAGRATISLMAGAMTDEVLSFRGGEPTFHPRMIAGDALPFPTGPRPTVLAPMADTAMVQATTKLPDLTVFMSPRPAWMGKALLALPGPLRTSRLYQRFVYWSMLFLRRILLASLPTPVELVAVAQRADGGTKRVTLSTMDGMAAGGAAIAAISLLARERRATLQPVTYVDQAMQLTETVARLNRLVPPGAEVRIDGA